MVQPRRDQTLLSGTGDGFVAVLATTSGTAVQPR